MLKNRRILLIIGLLIILIIAVIFTSTNNQNQMQPKPSPTPRIIYDLEKAEDDYNNRIASPSALSNSDQQAKNRLLQRLNGGSGVLQENTSYKIEYLQPLNLVSIKLFTNNIDQGKKDSMAWLQQQGLSLAGVCNLPIFFYLDGSVTKYLQEQGQTFDPTPPGCE